MGNIRQTNRRVYYSVVSIKDLLVIESHFQKYPLQTDKGADFLLFSKALNIHILKKKGHLSEKGLQEIVAIKSSMNWGISNTLQTAYPMIISVERPKIVCNDIHPQWLAGFATGEGSFVIRIEENSSNKGGFRVRLRFNITQHITFFKYI